MLIAGVGQIAAEQSSADEVESDSEFEQPRAASIVAMPNAHPGPPPAPVVDRFAKRSIEIENLVGTYRTASLPSTFDGVELKEEFRYGAN